MIQTSLTINFLKAFFLIVNTRSLFLNANAEKSVPLAFVSGLCRRPRDGPAVPGWALGSAGHAPALAHGARSSAAAPVPATGQGATGRPRRQCPPEKRVAEGL